jgi:hypothetical protein
MPLFGIIGPSLKEDHMNENENYDTRKNKRKFSKYKGWKGTELRLHAKGAWSHSFCP